MSSKIKVAIKRQRRWFSCLSLTMMGSWYSRNFCRATWRNGTLILSHIASPTRLQPWFLVIRKRTTATRETSVSHSTQESTTKRRVFLSHMKFENYSNRWSRRWWKWNRSVLRTSTFSFLTATKPFCSTTKWSKASFSLKKSLMGKRCAIFVLMTFSFVRLM